MIRFIKSIYRRLYHEPVRRHGKGLLELLNNGYTHIVSPLTEKDLKSYLEDIFLNR